MGCQSQNLFLSSMSQNLTCFHLKSVAEIRVVDCYVSALIGLVKDGGYESQREEWERQYAEAQARFMAHKKQKAEAKAADAAAPAAE